ncbi:MAG: hypothetical protein QME49_02320 [bacterium]|nr:hypothetical protein [bacterium]
MIGLTGMNAESEYPAFFNLKQLFEQAEVQDYLQMNQYQGVWYVHKESLEDMLYWLALVSDIHIMAEIEKQGKLVSEVLPPILARMDEAVAECFCLARSCAYQVEKIL